MGITKQQAITLLTETPYKIGHWLGFKDLTRLHNEWLRSFLYEKKDQTLLAHRGSYKTTDLSLFLALHTVERPNENVMFFRKTDTDVVEVMVQALEEAGNEVEVHRIKDALHGFFALGIKYFHVQESFEIMNHFLGEG